MMAKALPLVARFDGKEWDVLAEQPFTDEESEDLRFRTNDLWGERFVEMASDRSGRLWVANGYFYRVRELSPGGGACCKTSPWGRPRPNSGTRRWHGAS